MIPPSFDAPPTVSATREQNAHADEHDGVHSAKTSDFQDHIDRSSNSSSDAPESSAAQGATEDQPKTQPVASEPQPETAAEVSEDEKDLKDEMHNADVAPGVSEHPPATVSPANLVAPRESPAEVSAELPAAENVETRASKAGGSPATPSLPAPDGEIPPPVPEAAGGQADHSASPVDSLPVIESADETIADARTPSSKKARSLRVSQAAKPEASGKSPAEDVSAARPREATPQTDATGLANTANRAAVPAELAHDATRTLPSSSVDSTNSVDTATAAPKDAVPHVPPAAEHALSRSGPNAHHHPAAAVNQQRFVDRVVRALRSGADGQRVLRLRLSPPQLGSLRLELRMQGKTMSGRLEADTELAQSLLLEQMPHLRERLAQHGIQVKRLDVQLMDQPGNEPRNQLAHQHPDHQQHGTPGPHQRQRGHQLADQDQVSMETIRKTIFHDRSLDVWI